MANEYISSYSKTITKFKNFSEDPDFNTYEYVYFNNIDSTIKITEVYCEASVLCHGDLPADAADATVTASIEVSNDQKEWTEIARSRTIATARVKGATASITVSYTWEDGCAYKYIRCGSTGTSFKRNVTGTFSGTQSFDAIYVSELGETVNYSWSNLGSSYNGYYVYLSINGGTYNKIKTINSYSTTSDSYTIPSGQGGTYQFRVCGYTSSNTTSDYLYTDVYVRNSLESPTIGTVATYNPYVTATLSIPLTEGAQSNGDKFKRMVAMYYNGEYLCGSDYSALPFDNTSELLVYDGYAYKLGKNAYSGTFTIVAWTQNDNGSQSKPVQKDFTVNLNTDGGAVPTVGLPTFSGGELGNPATCFIANISTIQVTSGVASANRASSDTTLSYKISCTGKPTVNASTASFTNLSEGIHTITVTVTDSRGLSNTATKQFRVQSYSQPSVTSITATRLASPNTSAAVTYATSYTPIYQYTEIDTKGNQLNGISSQQYTIDNGVTWTNSTSPLTLTNLSTEATYVVTVRVADKVKTSVYASKNATVPTVIVPFALRRWGVGIRCVPQSDYALDVNGTAKIGNDLYTKGTVLIGPEKTAQHDGKYGLFLSGEGFMELSAATPFIDFHFGGSADDFTSRIIEETSGTLKMQSNVNVTGQMRANAVEIPESVQRGSTVVLAGTLSNDLSSGLAETQNYPTFVGTATVNSTWYNMISCRHRNGNDDGNVYGMYIQSNLIGDGNLVWNKQTGGTWIGEKVILDSANCASVTGTYIDGDYVKTYDNKKYYAQQYRFNNDASSYITSRTGGGFDFYLANGGMRMVFEGNGRIHRVSADGVWTLLIE